MTPEQIDKELQELQRLYEASGRPTHLTPFDVAIRNAWPRLLTLVGGLRAENERMSKGETWIAEQLTQMMVVIIPVLADAAIVTNKPFYADYVLSWVRQLAGEHVEAKAALARLKAKDELWNEARYITP